LQMMEGRTKRWVSPPQPSYSEKDIPKLLESLKENPDNHQTAEALSKLGLEARREAMAILMEALKNRRVRFPSNIIGSFQMFGTEAQPALPMLIAHARGDESSLANNAMSAIGAIGPGAIEAKPVVEAGLADGSPMTRWRAAYTLCQIDPARMDEYLPKLMEALEERSDAFMGDIRPYGIRTLAEFGPRAVGIAPQLEKYLQMEDTRLAAAAALVKIRPEGNAKLAALVAGELKNESWYARDEAARILGDMGGNARECLPQLRDAARSEDQEFAKIAAESIKKIEEAK
jgi:HEAT repeat protein